MSPFETPVSSICLTKRVTDALIAENPSLATAPRGVLADAFFARIFSPPGSLEAWLTAAEAKMGRA